LKVLFVCSGTSKAGMSPFVLSQGDSLKSAGINIEYFTINHHGLVGYLRASCQLKKYLADNEFDLIHAHYALSGWVALLTFSGIPVVVSLMGDDAYGTYNEKGKIILSSYFWIMLTKILQIFASQLIVKSNNIHETVWLKKKSSIIPNGIDMQLFDCNDKQSARKKLDLNLSGEYILFLGNPDETRKNIALAQKALDVIEKKDSFLPLFSLKHSDIPIYLSGSDMLLFTSTAEGSPNLIKEAMACNCPVVSTDVGDVKWVLGDTEGCFTTSFNSNEVAAKILLALEYAKTKNRTEGRKRIIELGLDAQSIAKRIIDVYRRVIS